MLRSLALSTLAMLVLATTALPARAQADASTSATTFEVDKERTNRQRILIASLGGGAVLVAAVGLLFHLDLRDKSDAVSASGPHTGMVYTDEVDDTRRSALRSRNVTIAAYGVGAGLLVATLVAYVITDPGTETIVLGEEAAPPVAVTIEPVAGGALVGGGWSF